MKLALSAGLVTVGFFTASLFGPPKGGEPSGATAAAGTENQLQPIATNRESNAAARDANVALAAHNGPAEGRSSGVSTAEWGATWSDWPPRTEASRADEARSGNLTPPPLAPSGERTATVHRPMSASAPNSAERTEWGTATGGSSRGLTFPEAPPVAQHSEPPATEPRSTFAQAPPSGPWANATPPPATDNAAAQQPWSSFPTSNLPSESPPAAAEWDPQSRESQPREAQPWEAERPVENSGEYRWHVVSDGDSLPRLAERYLRDANRSRELYELNRKVLTSPDLLPIGVELRIPPMPRADDAIEVFDARGATHNTVRPRRRVVALPELSDTAAQAPVARLRAPQAASERRENGYP